ncbi:hypothetical protein E2C01_042343 [Portunus trituberculatus]|uniref:Uncharacterized protein n=1 Tax=Portunus trituberculatus TaxID=210409 RepID=A0A5B7FT76_PORTR|nr:hypothetical protein [Portunus trituberculatus]
MYGAARSLQPGHSNPTPSRLLCAQNPRPPPVTASFRAGSRVLPSFVARSSCWPDSLKSCRRQLFYREL